MSITWTLKDNFAAVESAMRDACAAAMESSAQTIAANAAANAPVDTSALQNSIYVVTPNGSDYDQHVAAAVSQAATGGAKTPPKDISKQILPQALLLPDPNRIEAAVASVVDYAESVEEGGSRPNGTHAAPQPFLAPAGDGALNNVQDALATALQIALG